MPHFYYAIAITVDSRIFDEVIGRGNRKLWPCHNLDGRKNEKPPVVLDVTVAKSFKVAGKRMFLRGLRNRVNSAFKGSRNRDIICAEPQ